MIQMICKEVKKSTNLFTAPVSGDSWTIQLDLEPVDNPSFASLKAGTLVSQPPLRAPRASHNFSTPLSSGGDRVFQPPSKSQLTHPRWQHHASSAIISGFSSARSTVDELDGQRLLSQAWCISFPAMRIVSFYCQKVKRPFISGGNLFLFQWQLVRTVNSVYLKPVGRTWNGWQQSCHVVFEHWILIHFLMGQTTINWSEEI